VTALRLSPNLLKQDKGDSNGLDSISNYRRRQSLDLGHELDQPGSGSSSDASERVTSSASSTTVDSMTVRQVVCVLESGLHKLKPHAKEREEKKPNLKLSHSNLDLRCFSCREGGGGVMREAY